MLIVSLIYQIMNKATNWQAFNKLINNLKQKQIIEAIINKKRYNTVTATEVASNKYWDGHNWDRQGRSTTLFKTKKGNFFTYNETRWQGEQNSIRPLSKEEAMDIYEELPEQEMTYEEAFNVTPDEA